MPNKPQVRTSTGVDYTVTSGNTTANGIVVRNSASVDTKVTMGHVRNSSGVDTLFYQRRISNIIFNAGKWSFPVTCDKGYGIESETWTWVHGGANDPVYSSSGAKLDWWSVIGDRTGLTFRSNSQIDFSGYTRICMQYQKTHHGYFATGSAAAGYNCYISMAVNPILEYPSTSFPATKFVRNEMTRTLNTTVPVVLTIGSNLKGFVWFSFFTTLGNSGTVLLQKIWLE